MLEISTSLLGIGATNFMLLGICGLITVFRGQMLFVQNRHFQNKNIVYSYVMSIQACFDRGVDNCTTDNLCVLQYNADDQNPTCVPVDPNMYHVPRGTRTTVTEREAEFLQLVLARLLPPAGRVSSGGLNAQN